MADKFYNFSLVEFDDKGRLPQVDYACKSGDDGSPGMGVKINDAIIMAMFNDIKNKGVPENDSIHKIEKITSHSAIMYVGVSADFRLLVKLARKTAIQHKIVYHERISTLKLVQALGNVMQEHTQSSGIRPFGVTLLVCGWDDEGSLYRIDPSGEYIKWKAAAIGSQFASRTKILEKHYKEDMTLNKTIYWTNNVLRENKTAEAEDIDIQICKCTKDGVHILKKYELEFILDEIWSIEQPVKDDEKMKQPMGPGSSKQYQ